MFAKTTADKLGLRLATLAMFSLAALCGGRVNAQDAAEQRFSTMKAGMKALADNIQRQLSTQGLNTVAVKGFEGPAGASASSGIAKALSDQLAALTPKVDTATGPGNWSVAGNFFVDQNKTSGKAEIFIESTLKTPQGRPHAKLLTPIITSDSETLTMFGVTATLPTQVTPEQAAAGKDLAEVRSEAVVQAIDKPQVTVEAPAAAAPAAPGAPPAVPSVVKPTPQSPFAMEVLIGGKPIAGAVEDGAAFVAIPRDAIYEIRLINNSDDDVGVTLTIDGINTLAFSQTPGFKELGKWVIGRRSSGLIRGWHIQGPISKSFKVMDYGESAAAKFAATKDIGTITAVFCGAFVGPLPPNEQALLKGAKGQDATGFGPDVEQKFAPVVRSYGADRAAISIRYSKPDLSDLPPAEAPPAASPPAAAPPALAN
jgi:hypothetical protein